MVVSDEIVTKVAVAFTMTVVPEAGSTSSELRHGRVSLASVILATVRRAATCIVVCSRGDALRHFTVRLAVFSGGLEE